MNAAIYLTQAQHLIVNAMLLIPNDTTFTQTSMGKKSLQHKKNIEAGGKSDTRGDDKLIFF